MNGYGGPGNLAVQCRALVKRFGGKNRVDGIDLDIGRGELFSLLGPNGAGKTTTIRMLCTLLKPSAGTANVLGHDVIRQGAAVRRLIAMSPQETAVAGHLGAAENIELMGGLAGLGEKALKDRVEELLELMGLADRRREQARRLSGGQQRKLSIAMALVSEPQLLFLDEPTLGLDPLSRRELWDHISALKGRTTILLTTHYLEEADALADRVAIIKEGKIAASGTPAELKAAVGGGAGSPAGLEEVYFRYAGKE